MEPPYDGLLLVSFGGPEKPEDVIPFLENVLRGKTVPQERIREVAQHYEMLGGASPINTQNRALLAALVAELNTYGPHLPVYWGNRNWHPLLPDTLQEMAEDGIRCALAFITSAFASYSGCRQYLEDIEAREKRLGPTLLGSRNCVFSTIIRGSSRRWRHASAPHWRRSLRRSALQVRPFLPPTVFPWPWPLVPPTWNNCTRHADWYRIEPVAEIGRWPIRAGAAPPNKRGWSPTLASISSAPRQASAS